MPLDLVIYGGLQFYAPLLGLSEMNRNGIIDFRKNQKYPKNSIYKLWYVFIKDIKIEAEKLAFLFIYIMDINHGYISIIYIILMYKFCFLVFLWFVLPEALGRHFSTVKIGSS